MKTIIAFMLMIQLGYSQEYYYYKDHIQVIDETYLKQYTQEFNLTIEKKLSENLYLLKISNKNKILDMANNLTQKEGVVYAHPDFIKKQLFR